MSSTPPEKRKPTINKMPLIKDPEDESVAKPNTCPSSTSITQEPTHFMDRALAIPDNWTRRIPPEVTEDDSDEEK